MTNPIPVQGLSEERGLVDTVPTEVYLAYEDRAKGIATRAMTETPAAIKNAILRFVLEARLSVTELQHSRAAEAVAWPRATGKSAEAGWTLDVDYLERIGKLALEKCGYDATTEFVEAVLLSASPASPSATGVRVTDAQVEKAAREFLLHKGETPWRVTRRGAELWEDYVPAMRAALEAAALVEQP